ncbi:YrhB domain-containing protein [Rhodocytophaga aerolata]|uniref:YrhB domain-containing protein n=1 Tax=Rhodocytophaga aerolata TaxID=455078 RepID=A0ABT8R822_9BACT|nr:YrhB domain-containing protein [Rhodocytophaga aerolata]MDO1448244.1 YrhB domain-containing protein [Rhodocytophaga aerolata]
MITIEEAKANVYKIVCNLWKSELSSDDELIILDSETIEKENYWVFFYTSKLWFETNELRYAVAGNAPIIVNKKRGEMKLTGTAYPIEKYMAEYEEEIEKAK